MSEIKLFIDEEMKNKNLLDILLEKGTIIERPCGGKGICGKCKIIFKDGRVNPLTEEEKRFLSEDEINNGYRLACMLHGEGEVVLETVHKESKHRVLTEGYMPEVKINPIINKKLIKIDKPTLENNISYEESLEKTLGVELSNEDLELERSLYNLYGEEEATLVYSKDKLIGVEGGDTREKLYGVAIDIGTTTVALSLVDLKTGEEIEKESAINPQKEYGLDVLTRIDFIKRNENGLEVLKNAIVKCINDLISKVCIKAKVDNSEIYEVAVAANATMMHILLGVNTNSIGKSPYVTVFSKEKYFKAKDVGINICDFGRVYCIPCVSSYIGADIVAGAVVCDLISEKENVLFIDIGTNGEIILCKGGELTSCSCAAGPALEGMNISCGMRAADGAIEEINITSENVDFKTIGEEIPRGICGSGILDIVSELWRQRLIGKTGRLIKAEDALKKDEIKELASYIREENKKRSIFISKEDNIFVTQEDIRQVQLAKGAIASGFYALLDEMDISMDDLHKVVISGQFGKHLKVSSLSGVGIIPKELSDKVVYVGNSSKTGALMSLLSKEARDEMQRVAKHIEYIELSTKDNYEKLFTKCLNFN